MGVKGFDDLRQLVDVNEGELVPFEVWEVLFALKKQVSLGSNAGQRKLVPGKLSELMATHAS
jgi:hypothetical protein